MPETDSHSSRLERLKLLRAGQGDLRLSHVLGGLSAALDLADGQRPGHAVRTALIGMRLGQFIGLNDTERATLLHALLVKDLGASANAAKFAALFGAGDHEIKSALRTVNWARALEAARFAAKHVRPGAGWVVRPWRAMAVMAKGTAGVKEVARARADYGADGARALALPADVVAAVRSVDEHWDGGGFPLGLRAHAIHPFARIATLAQALEVAASTGGPRAAFELAAARRGQWFEPALVDALVDLKDDEPFWQSIDQPDALARLLDAEPAARAVDVDGAGLTRVALVFARAVDAKSPWTLGHSEGVAALAVDLGRELGLRGDALVDLRRAALLHDLGKLGVPNTILDKPGALSVDERRRVERHTADTADILRHTPGLSAIAEIAAAHHERLDGQGYHRGLTATALPVSARVLAAADIAHALRTSRPYRPGLPTDHVLTVMAREAGAGLDPDCVAALRRTLSRVPADVSDQMPVVHVVAALCEDYTQAA